MVAGILGTFSTDILQTSDVGTMDWGFDKPALEQQRFNWIEPFSCEVSNHT